MKALSRVSPIFVVIVALNFLIEVGDFGLLRLAYGQNEEQIIAAIAISEFNSQFLPELDNLRNSSEAVQYKPFEVTHVAVEGEWGRIHIMSRPLTPVNEDGTMPGPIFRGAVARRVHRTSCDGSLGAFLPIPLSRNPQQGRVRRLFRRPRRRGGYG